jgi:hypothetical protein
VLYNIVYNSLLINNINNINIIKVSALLASGFNIIAIKIKL